VHLRTFWLIIYILPYRRSWPPNPWCTDCFTLRTPPWYTDVLLPFVHRCTSVEHGPVCYLQAQTRSRHRQTDSCTPAVRRGTTDSYCQSVQLSRAGPTYSNLNVPDCHRPYSDDVDQRRGTPMDTDRLRGGKWWMPLLRAMSRRLQMAADQGVNAVQNRGIYASFGTFTHLIINCW